VSDRRPAAEAGSHSGEQMRRFWDRRARERAMWFINSSLDFRSPDTADFWESGETDLQVTLDGVGASFTGTERVLEIGCGIGRMTRALARRSASILGIDVSDEMVARARHALSDLENVELQVGNGTDLSDLASGCFDTCYSYVVFQHIPDPAITCRYIAEMGRVLRPGGWALFQVSDTPEIHDPRTWARSHGMRYRLGVLAGRRPRGCAKPQWLGSAVSRRELLSAMERGGLALEAESGQDTQYHLVLGRRRS
jgi:SAM-dependent methyltransferase